MTIVTLMIALTTLVMIVSSVSLIITFDITDFKPLTSTRDVTNKKSEKRRELQESCDRERWEAILNGTDMRATRRAEIKRMKLIKLEEELEQLELDTKKKKEIEK